MDEAEKETILEQMKKEVKEFPNKLKEDTENQKWTVRKNGMSVMNTRTEAFQLVGVVIQHLFEPLNFQKKFRIVIEHDPDSKDGWIRITHYE